jgi:hypothetical protein
MLRLFLYRSLFEAQICGVSNRATEYWKPCVKHLEK